VGTIDERVAAVEARVGEQSVTMDAIRQSVDRLDQRVTALDGRVDQRFTALEARIDHRFTALEAHLDQRFSAIDQRFGLIDQRFLSLDARFGALDVKMSRQFQFLVGIQITMFLVIAAMGLR
jgi:uncharacterized coiled-coil protein SlyX